MSLSKLGKYFFFNLFSFPSSLNPKTNPCLKKNTSKKISIVLGKTIGGCVGLFLGEYSAVQNRVSCPSEVDSHFLHESTCLLYTAVESSSSHSSPFLLLTPSLMKNPVGIKQEAFESLLPFSWPYGRHRSALCLKLIERNGPWLSPSPKLDRPGILFQYLWRGAMWPALSCFCSLKCF